MVFSNNFVASIKCNGKILREFKDVVKLPFGSEYSILLKNLDSRSCVVSVSIDGQDVLGNSRLILRPNTDLELEGFKKGKRVRNKFKFIEKTEDISDFRGDKVDDGIIRVEYTFEKAVKEVDVNYNYNPKVWYTANPVYSFYTTGNTYGACNSVQRSLTNSGGMSSGSGGITNKPTLAILGDSRYKEAVVPNDAGITVKGSDEVDQSFVKGTTKVLENMSSVITIKLVGYHNKNKVIKPITVKTKTTCTTCGKKNKSSGKFCFNCGTYL